ncbi:MAG: CHAT domain-containing protein [Pyrinomonadaceae bacterium]|nr:CHAT domain-containing protein [Pyrinomonadaceae bacterium]
MVVLQKGIDVVATLFAPDGKKMLEVDSPNGANGVEPLWFVADATGNYRVEIKSLENEAKPGRYEAKIEELRAAVADDKYFISGKKLLQEVFSLLSERKEESRAEAIKKLREAESFFRLMEDKKRKAAALQQIGRNYRLANEVEEAKKNFIEAANLFKETKLNRDAAIAYLDAGKASSTLAEALSNFENALAVSREEGGDKKIEVSTLIEIGNTYYYLGDFNQSLQNYRQALAISREIGYQEKTAKALDNMGSAYTQQSDFINALEAHQKALLLTESLGLTREIPGTLLNIGNVYESQGNHPQALAHFEKALTEFEKMRAPVGIAYATSNIGSVYLNSGDYDKALEYFQKAQQQKAKVLAKDPFSFLNIGLVYSYQDKTAEAIEYFQKARSLSEETGNTNTFTVTTSEIADVYFRQGEFLKSLEYAEKAVKLADQFDYPDLYSSAQTVAAKAYLALNKKKEARQALESAIAKIEKLRSQVAGSENEQTGFFAGKLEPFQLLVGLAISENADAEAFSYAERAKSRALLDVLQSGKTNFSKIMTAAERQRENALKNEIASINNQIANSSEQAPPNKSRITDLADRLQKKRLEFEDFQTRLYAAHPELKVQRGEMKPISLEEAGKLLPDSQSALLEYTVGGDKTYLFVLTKENQTAVSLKVYPIDVRQNDLAVKTENFRLKLAKGDLDFSKQARDLYDLLLKPANAQIKNKNKLIIVPDASLWNLPFQALQPVQNKYLIESTAISYAPSLTTLREMVKKNKNKMASSAVLPLLAFGNPIISKETSSRATQLFMGERLAPLPEAERLVNSLKQMYGATKSKIYVGAEASEETAKTESPKYRILQFAAHGILNDANPMYSHLVLAQKQDDSNEDGLLEAWEMKDLDLKADLVILSGCETARGKTASGEGVIGMSWALFIAGAPTTVASQWKVESASTTELMLEFHRQLLNAKNVSEADALRNASLKLLKMPQYKHPSYWAGFVAIGDGF